MPKNPARGGLFMVAFVVLEPAGVINKSGATMATLKTKNLTSAVYSNNCMAIANHFIMRSNPGFKTVDLKYLMTGL